MKKEKNCGIVVLRDQGSKCHIFVTSNPLAIPILTNSPVKLIVWPFFELGANSFLKDCNYILLMDKESTMETCIRMLAKISNLQFHEHPDVNKLTKINKLLQE
jgi:hypothetical protein